MFSTIVFIDCQQYKTEEAESQEIKINVISNVILGVFTSITNKSNLNFKI